MDRHQFVTHRRPEKPYLPPKTTVRHDNPFGIRLQPDEPYPLYPVLPSFRVDGARYWGMNGGPLEAACHRQAESRKSFSRPQRSARRSAHRSSSGLRKEVHPYSEPIDPITEVTERFECLDHRTPHSKESPLRREAAHQGRTIEERYPYWGEDKKDQWKISCKQSGNVSANSKSKQDHTGRVFKTTRKNGH